MILLLKNVRKLLLYRITKYVNMKKFIVYIFWLFDKELLSYEHFDDMMQ